jgi:hypothetical protein
MKVSLRTAFVMTRHSNAKALYEDFLVKTNSIHWNVNIMMFGDIGIAGG